MTQPSPATPENDAGVELDQRPGSPALLVTFAGGYGGMHMPPFEFKKITSSLDASVLMLRDRYRAWFQFGIPGVASNFGGVARYVRDVQTELGAKRLVLVGSSMGGWAVLAAACHITVDEVHAFVPPTFLSRRLRARHGERRWTDLIDGMYARGHVPWRYRDLRRLFAMSWRAYAGRAELNIHYARSFRPDAFNAGRLKRFPRVFLRPHDEGDHNLVKIMRDKGQLLPLLERAVTGR